MVTGPATAGPIPIQRFNYSLFFHISLNSFAFGVSRGVQYMEKLLT